MIDAKKRETLIRQIQALLNTNGCTEEEAETKRQGAQRLMEKYAIDEESVADLGEKIKMYTQALKVKHPDSPWRRSVIGEVARNTGVYSVHNRGVERVGSTGSGQTIMFGREAMVIGSCMVAEFLVNAIDRLSAEYASRTGSGQKGRRDFAKACASRVCRRIKESFNLASDPKLPLIISQMRDLAEAEYTKDNKVNKGRGWKVSGSEHAWAGHKAADSINLRGAHERKKIAQ